MTARIPGASGERAPAVRPAARAAEPAIPAVPHTPLLVAGPFGRLSSAAVADALASGLRAGGGSEVDVCAPGDTTAGPHFEARVRRARAVVIAQRDLSEDTLRDSAVFEIATRARQAGVPCFAVTARNGLSAFDARVLDLQLVLEAGTRAALARAGRALAAML